MIKNIVNKIKEIQWRNKKMIHCCDFCGCCFFYRNKHIHTDPQNENIHYIVCPQCKIRTTWVGRNKNEVSTN